jgi:hypothetical protein
MRKIFLLLFLGLVFSFPVRSQSHSATLSWVDSVTSGVVSYDVYRVQCTVPYSNVGGSFPNKACSYTGSFSLMGNTSGSGFVDSSISAGQSYEYYVTAVCGSSCSAGAGAMSGPSNTVVITVAPYAPTNMKAPSVQ